MRLLIVIINERDTESTLNRLVEEEFRVTKIASTGGFLRKNNTTLLIGTEEARVDEAIELIREATSPGDEGQRRATVFVLNVAEFNQL